MQTQSCDVSWPQAGTSINGNFGDFTILMNSTNFRARWMVISTLGGGGNARIRIADGPFTNPGFPGSGSTTGTVFIDRMLCPGSGQGMNGGPVSFEVDIPAATQLGYQVEAIGQTALSQIQVTITDAPLGLDITGTDESPRVTLTMPGDDTSDSSTEELIASLSIAPSWMVFSMQTRDLTANNNNRIRVDVMQGPIGFETILVEDLGGAFFQSTNVRPQSNYHCMPIADVPAGTRISARAMFIDSGAGATHTQDIHVGVTFFGV